MELSANKGEWSEIYAFFKMLGDGLIHAGDAEMNKLEVFYPIVKILRDECQHFEYEIEKEAKLVLISADGQEFARVPMKRFEEEATRLFEIISEAHTGTFGDEQTELFMHEVGCQKVKASSRDKTDIRIVLYDERTSMSHNLGFSIKSQLGSPSTLLNASAATNITFRIEGKCFTDAEISDINAIDAHKQRMNALMETGAKLVLHEVENKTFRNNLRFLDCCMAQFVAECLAVNASTGNNSIKECVAQVAETNPFAYDGDNRLAFYEHKMKVLLIDVALGMMPSTVWDGRYDANGGYLIVRKDGEIICYHFYNRNDIEDYLFCNTRFENASRSRHDFGYLYRADDGTVRIKLNLQIRFVH